MSSSAYVERVGRLVVDANILIGAVLGGTTGGTRLLLARLVGVGVVLLAPEELLSELDKHLPHLIERKLTSQFSPERRVEAMEAAMVVWRDAVASVSVVPATEYRHFESVARKRISADPDDWPYIALALRLECGILTKNIAHFGGSGIPIWDLAVAALLLDQ